MASDPRQPVTPGAPHGGGLIAGRAVNRLETFPWWLLITILIGLFILFLIFTNQEMTRAFYGVVGFIPFNPERPETTGPISLLTRGLVVTLRVALLSYLLAVTIGLFVGLARVSKNVLLNNLASFYVEVVRGVPILVLLLYIAFVAVPFFADLFSFSTRDFNNEWRVIMGLAIAYGAFESEIFRAGIQSIERGQMEAARALGLSYFQAMRHVIVPQAIRRVLPALGNDFIAMLKDSSLVSVLGVEDITQLTKLFASSSFLFFQTYSILAFMYLTMTILLSRGVRYLEYRLSADRR